MSFDAQQLRQIAEAFTQARRDAKALDAYPGSVPATLDEAYRVQDLAISRWNDRVSGWKVGGIPPQYRAEHGGADRLVGPVFQRQIIAAVDGQTVRFPVFAGGFGAVEAEFVFRIAQDCGPGECPPQQAAHIVDRVFFGVETAGSPFAGINDHGPTVTISDFGNNHGLIVGPEVPDWRAAAFGDTPVTTIIDGVTVGTGSPNALAGGPLASLAFLLEVLARRGLSLSKGDLITTGAVTGVHRVDVGAHSEVLAEGIGRIELRAVEAQTQ